MKVTDWYAPEQKPKRKGVYERDVDSTWMAAFGCLYSYWDGSMWGSLDKSLKGALDTREYESEFQSLPWRGLAERPKK